jgi:hypothetical protein
VSSDDINIVPEVFRRLTEESVAGTKDWTPAERGVWNIVSAACQKDMGGIETVFTDCSAVVGHELVTSLRFIEEEELADAWAKAYQTFERQGALARGEWTGREFDSTAMDELEAAVGDRMWDLDDKLAAWLRRSS